MLTNVCLRMASLRLWILLKEYLVPFWKKKVNIIGDKSVLSKNLWTIDWVYFENCFEIQSIYIVISINLVSVCLISKPLWKWPCDCFLFLFRKDAWFVMRILLNSCLPPVSVSRLFDQEGSFSIPGAYLPLLPPAQYHQQGQGWCTEHQRGADCVWGKVQVLMCARIYVYY